MAVEVPRAEREREGMRDRLIAVLAVVGVVALIALGITLWGGYGPDEWSWTGYEGEQLWDWLHILLLPIAFGLVAVLVRAKELGVWRFVIGGTFLGLFIALVVAGYAIPWDWTGFEGNTVWDWLELTLLPLTLSVLAAFKFDVGSVERRHMLAISVFLVTIAVFAVGGYTQGWDWTGFEGNTLFDWLQLLVLPLVIPFVVIPAVVELRRRHVNAQHTPDPGPTSQAT